MGLGPGCRVTWQERASEGRTGLCPVRGRGGPAAAARGAEGTCPVGPGRRAGLGIMARGGFSRFDRRRTGGGGWEPTPGLEEEDRLRGTESFSFDPDDAAVETAEEAKEPAEADITELCRDMFSKMATYLTGELTGEAEAGGCG